MNYREYVATTTASANDILADWRWLMTPNLQIWHVTKAGDALLRDSADGSIHFLDTIAGKVQRIAGDRAEFEGLVATGEYADQWLMPEIVDSQASLGMRPGINECLSFKHPPALGGQLEPDNFETCSIPIHFSIAGQIHRQIRDLPPGTPVTNIKTEMRQTERTLKFRWLVLSLITIVVAGIFAYLRWHGTKSTGS